MKSTFEIRAFIETEDGIQSWPLDRMDEIPEGHKIEFAIYLNLPDGTQQWLSDLNMTVESFKLLTETGLQLVEAQKVKLDNWQKIVVETVKTLQVAVGKLMMYKGHYEDMVELVESSQGIIRNHLSKDRLIVP